MNHRATSSGANYVLLEIPCPNETPFYLRLGFESLDGKKIDKYYRWFFPGLDSPDPRPHISKELFLEEWT